MTIEISIDLPIKSPNVTMRMHWRRRREYNRQVLEAVWLAARQAGIRGRPKWTPIELDIELRCGGVMDEDNAVGACKPLIDALTKLGIIPDDSPVHIPKPPNVTQKKAPRNERGASIRISVGESAADPLQQGRLRLFE